MGLSLALPEGSQTEVLSQNDFRGDKPGKVEAKCKEDVSAWHANYARELASLQQNFDGKSSLTGSVEVVSLV